MVLFNRDSQIVGDAQAADESFAVTRFRSSDGIDIVADVGGDATARPVILLHGGGQTRHSWKSAARALLAGGYHVVNVDLRGHGDSGWSPNGRYSGRLFVEDLRALVAQMPQPPVLVGASLGGMVSLYAAGSASAPFASALVLVDIAPKVEADGVDQVIHFMASTREGFPSLEAAAEAIAQYLPHRKKPRSTDGLAKNLRRGDDGRWRWHWDPEFVTGAQSRRSEDVQADLRLAARGLDVPTLLVRGSNSRLVSEDSVRDLRELVPHAEFVDVQGAHHMVAGDDNDAFNQAVLEFLQRKAPPRPERA